MRYFLWLFLSPKGRISRREFWAYLILPVVTAGVVAALVVPTLFLTPEIKSLIEDITLLLLFWPSIAVQIKRWHDVDKSGWWILLNIIPIVGALVFLGIGFLRGTRGNNRFGSDPAA